jgi:hypothetical protein
MSKFLPLSLAALALVAACAEDPITPAPAPVVVVPPAAPVVTSPPQVATAPVVVPSAVRPGFGRIESMTALPSSAAAGGTASGSTQRFGIKMDDGTVQYVDSGATGVMIGDRVELTREGTMRR